jgi:hypothetical protein
MVLSKINTTLIVLSNGHDSLIKFIIAIVISGSTAIYITNKLFPKQDDS